MQMHVSTVNLKAATIRQHYYPEGSWGWIILLCSIVSHVITSGLQLSYGILIIYLLRQPFAFDKYMSGVWIGSLSLCVSMFVSPVVVSWCRRHHSTRLTAIVGGLIASLGCLFASFATQFHQLVISYGIFLAVGIGIIRESTNLMIGQYFKRKRNFVEIFVQSSIGIGISLMSLFLNWSFNFKHWRAGLQLITCALFSTFFLAILYRPASIYHPQRRAILHLKIQRRKIREKNPQHKKPPFFDLTPLKTFTVQIIMCSTAFFSFGFLSSLFYFNKFKVLESNQFINSSLISFQPTLTMNLYFGSSFTIGVFVVGFIMNYSKTTVYVNKQYLCQTIMIINSLLLLASIYLSDNHYSLIIFVIVYGTLIGSFYYVHKMFVFEVVRAKNWMWIQFAQSIPFLLGIPITGYINLYQEHFGFIFSSLCCLIGGLILCFLSLNKVSNEKYHTCDQHLCNPSENNPNEFHLNQYNNVFGDDVIDSHCCNCDKKLKIITNIGTLSQGDGTNSKIVHETDDYFEEDDDLVYNKVQSTNGNDFETFFSEDLCNYYLQNEQKDDENCINELIVEEDVPNQDEDSKF